MKKEFTVLAKGIGVLLAINVLASFFFIRWDLTEDKRYTLSDASITTAQQLEDPVIIDVLLDGTLPSEFAKLKTETTLLLEQFASQNNNISYELVNPLEDATTRENTVAQLQQLGLTPANVTVEENGKVSQELVFPWAMVNYRNKTVKVPLLKNKLGSTAQDRINNSVQQLEYAFADAFTKLGIAEKKRIAVLKGNGELDDIYIADYLTEIREYYNIGAITLDSVATNPQRVLDQLKGFDMILVAKPTQAFSDSEKYVLDQFIVNGGKSLWLLDKVAMQLDSLFNDKGSNLATNKDLGLGDLFFRYGIRLRTELVNDLYNTPIVLATGEANESQYNPLPWVYHPMVFSKNNHPINSNIEALRLQFASHLDTLKNTYKKTILLQSSPLSKLEKTPTTISLNSIGLQPDKETYVNQGGYALGVLISGDFQSAYKNRVKPLDLATAKEQGPSNRMIVISDGDIIRNQLRKGQPLPLGYDKWTNNTYGNKEFLINCTNFLLEDTGLINIRNRKVSVPLLDVEKIANQKSKWQLINIGIPVVFTILLGMAMYYFRRRNYKV